MRAAHAHGQQLHELHRQPHPPPSLLQVPVECSPSPPTTHSDAQDRVRGVEVGDGGGPLEVVAREGRQHAHGSKGQGPCLEEVVHHLLVVPGVDGAGKREREESG